MVRISPTLQQTQAKFHGSRLGSSPWEGSATHPFNRQTATAETLEGCHWGERRKTLQELGEIDPGEQREEVRGHRGVTVSQELEASRNEGAVRTWG